MQAYPIRQPVGRPIPSPFSGLTKISARGLSPGHRPDGRNRMPEAEPDSSSRLQPALLVSPAALAPGTGRGAGTFAPPPGTGHRATILPLMRDAPLGVIPGAAKDLQPLKIAVYEDTPVGTMVQAFRNQKGIEPGKAVVIQFDGEELREDMLVGDMDIERDEPNQFEVYIK